MVQLNALVFLNDVGYRVYFQRDRDRHLWDLPLWAAVFPLSVAGRRLISAQVDRLADALKVELASLGELKLNMRPIKTVRWLNYGCLSLHGMSAFAPRASSKAFTEKSKVNKGFQVPQILISTSKLSIHSADDVDIYSIPACHTHHKNHSTLQVIAFALSHLLSTTLTMVRLFLYFCCRVHKTLRIGYCVFDRRHSTSCKDLVQHSYRVQRLLSMTCGHVLRNIQLCHSYV